MCIFDLPQMAEKRKEQSIARCRELERSWIRPWVCDLMSPDRKWVSVDEIEPDERFRIPVPILKVWFEGSTDDITDAAQRFRPKPDPRNDLYPYLSPLPLTTLEGLALGPELALGYLLLLVRQDTFLLSDSWSMAMQQLRNETRLIKHVLVTRMKTASCSTGRRACKYCQVRQLSGRRRRCATLCKSCLPSEVGLCLPIDSNAEKNEDLSCLQCHILEDEEQKFQEIVIDPIHEALGRCNVPGWRELIPPSPTDIMQPHHLKRLKGLVANNSNIRSYDSCEYCGRRTTFFCHSCHVRSRSQPIPICLPWKGRGACYYRHVVEDFDSYYDVHFDTGDDIADPPC
jgi:hypothetical protein